MRHAIAAAQIAIAVVLLFTGVQLSRSFLHLTRIDTGFYRANIWTGAVTLPSHGYLVNQSWNTNFFLPLLDKVRRIPGVQAASGTSALPFNPSGVWTEEFRLPGKPAMQQHPEAQIGLAFPGYFETIGITVLKGRSFTDLDRSGSQPVAIIDDQLMRRYFADENPLGRLIASGGAATPARIVGVVGSVQNRNLGGPREPEVYYSALQERVEATYVVLRTDPGVSPTETVRQAVASLDPGVALYDVQSMDMRVAGSLKVRRFMAFLLSALALTGLTLAIVGLYGSISHLVALRQREIGIRLALGAGKALIFNMIFSRALTVIVLGILAGIGGCMLSGKMLQAQLFGVRMYDGETWLAVLACILLVSTLASCIPAWRATAIQPSVALRSE